MAEQERDEDLELLLECYGNLWYQRPGGKFRETGNAIHARVAELVAAAREEGRQEGRPRFTKEQIEAMRAQHQAAIEDDVARRLAWMARLKDMSLEEFVKLLVIDGEPIPTGTITAIGKPDAFDKVLASDPPPIFTPTETGATP